MRALRSYMYQKFEALELILEGFFMVTHGGMERRKV